MYFLSSFFHVSARLQAPLTRTLEMYTTNVYNFAPYTTLLVTILHFDFLLFFQASLKVTSVSCPCLAPLVEDWVCFPSTK